MVVMTMISSDDDHDDNNDDMVMTLIRVVGMDCDADDDET